MSKTILESGISFVADNAFHIEQSETYKALNKGVKSVEFIRRKDNSLLFVEAKTTFPNPKNSDTSFNNEANDIVDKFIHSLNLYAAISLKVHSENIAMTNSTAEENVVLQFVLVIRNHETQWCKKVQMKLQEILNHNTYFREIWRPEIFVLNHCTAVECGLAVNTTTE